ncbi:MAG: lysylphosphatidylglycerol synthase transmembrane domain-containing protein [Dehalococcoidia bacterium]
MIGAAVSAIFVALFLRRIDVGGVADAFRDANVLLILLALAVYFAGTYMRAVRWHYLMQPIKPVPPHKLYPIVAIGYATNNVLPFRTGEIVRAHVLNRRHGVSRTAGLSNIFIERVFDGLMLTVFLCVGVAASLVGFQGMRYAGDLLLAAMAFLAFGVSAAFALLYATAKYPDAAERVVRRVTARLPVLRRFDSGWVQSVTTGLAPAKDKRIFVAGLWTSAVAWGLEAFMYFLVGEAFGLDQPFPVYLLIAAAANIIITAPSTSGGVGPFEWAAKEVLLIFLVAENAEEVAIAYAASLHGLVLIPMTVLGLLLLWLYQVPLGRVAKGGDVRQQEAEARPEPQPR